MFKVGDLVLVNGYIFHSAENEHICAKGYIISLTNYRGEDCAYVSFIKEQMYALFQLKYLTKIEY